MVWKNRKKLICPECYLSEDMCRLERQIRRIAIPFFIIDTIILIMKEWTWTDFLRSTPIAIISILLFWYVTRVIIFYIKSKNYDDMYVRAGFIQVLLSLAATTVLTIGIFMASHHLFFYLDLPFHKCIFHIKNLLINALLFTLLINGIYMVIFLVQKWNNEKTEKEEYKKSVIESRLENLRIQINPHFLFNTFNALSELIDVNPKKASQIMLELSDVYRYVLNARDKNWISLEDEHKIFHSFIEILRVRYEENVDIQCNIDEEFFSWYIPPLSIQMLLENAIKHNEISSDKKLKIEIFTKENYLVVQNNLQKRKNIESSNGVGLENIKTRYQFLINKEVIIEETSTHFVVKLPLVKMIKDESSNH